MADDNGERFTNSHEAGLSRTRFDDEGVPTATSTAQKKLERCVGLVYVDKYDEFPDLKRSLHIGYLLNTLKNLPQSFEVMDSSRTWIVYWTLHSLALLNHELDASMKTAVINFLNSCQHAEGGFGGGPGQDAHLAPTYAAVNALCIIGSDEALSIINVKTMTNFLQRMRVGDGSFYMHTDGEIDMRSVYCSAVIASLLNVQNHDIFEKSVDWISRCQTYEGGFSGTPGMEAHGGYTFCGISSLYLLGSVDKCDMKSLHRWILNRQTSFEGGFQGRTNKLVDSCYSFWQCGSLAILNLGLMSENLLEKNQCEWHFDSSLLQEYLLICCQHIYGGFIDKPTTSQDPYHTCYSLSGLSLAQSPYVGDADVLGAAENKLVELHPVYNLPMNAVKHANNFFGVVDGEDK
ncbi:farnesyl transferase beta subunit isoform X2 [Rhodnius prolixus]|uniref:farnesyl transferase beta subunit isoform X2 n=1 Tax=Rhodnius prolixus TaxID=13249 RepID=UPI003D18F40F